MWNTHITIKNMYSIQWGKPIKLVQQWDWPPDNRFSVWFPTVSIFILPLCKGAYRNCLICPSLRPSSSLNWRTDWQISTSFDMGISDNCQDRVISVVTRLWTEWPGFRIQVLEWDYLEVFSKIPRPALGPLQAPIHWVWGGAPFPGRRATGMWSWPLISKYNVKNKWSYTFIPLYVFKACVGIT